MKAISLWQPHASLMAYGLKKIETRSWATKYRGPLLIHAAQKIVLPKNLRDWGIDIQKALEYLGLDWQYLPTGCLLGSGVLFDCKKTSPAFIGRPPYPRLYCGSEEECFGDYSEGRFAWAFKNIVAFEKPIPFKGKQGFFNVPDELIAEWGKQ